MKATDVLWLSTCDAGKYPLAKKQQSMEYLREIAHLRPRTQTIGCVARIRSALAFATHAFFSGQGFLHLHSPIVTASDCEGAGEMFQVRGVSPCAWPDTCMDSGVVHVCHSVGGEMPHMGAGLMRKSAGSCFRQ